MVDEQDDSFEPYEYESSDGLNSDSFLYTWSYDSVNRTTLQPKEFQYGFPRYECEANPEHLGEIITWMYGTSEAWGTITWDDMRIQKPDSE